MSIDVEQIRNRILELESELEDLRVTLKVIERYSGEVAEPTSMPKAELRGENGIFDLNSIKLPEISSVKRPTLLDDIRDVVMNLGDQEFTVTHIEFLLKELGKATDAPSFKNRVAKNIKVILDEGNVIERVHKGSGKDPHVYKRLLK
ncbi:hypothetical protein ACTBAC_004504 [Vibrio parahaemolyticus]|uniref:hypothetical protein n=1 Tax=Vibrio parahaemolyticus TaxID=670 RepID=UPI00069D974C|nr:hypothetical protein [Vibrio parahaemolyticus]AKU54691.1 hypothetical protein FORC8_1131 [Vibrio parahaemolyticus]APE83747.1 hypothetical protein FORC18_1134 [Vibrio parahaemolyticus]EGU9323533.1 hypothetical protein [Vibrio parahaemolyticus]